MRALNYTYISKVNIDIFMWQWRYIHTDTQDWTCWGSKLCIKWDWDIERRLYWHSLQPNLQHLRSLHLQLWLTLYVHLPWPVSLQVIHAADCWLEHLYIERIYHWIKWFIVTIKRVQSRPDVRMEFLTEIRYYLCKLLLMVKNSAQHF